MASAILFGAGAMAQNTPSTFTQPSSTSEYLNFIRARASASSESQRRPGVITQPSKTPRGYPSIPGIPQIPTGPTIPSPPSSSSYPAYPTPGAGLGPSAANLGRGRFGIPELSTRPAPADPYASSATYPTYPTYSPLSGPSLFPAGLRPGQIPGIPQSQQPQAQTQSQSDPEFDAYRQFQEARNLNPYRSEVFRSGASEGRFGRQDQFLSQSALNFGRRASKVDNLQFGDLTLRIGLVGGLDYTDNALFSPTNKTEDIIGRGGMQIYARYPLSKKNALTLNLGVGYDRYLLNPELNELIRSSGFDATISPGSRLSYEAELGNIFLTIFDTFAVYQRTEDDFLSEVETNFAQFNNTIGIGADWLVNEATNLTGSLNRVDRLSLDENFSSFDTTSYNLLGSIAYSPRDTWTIGLQGAVTTNDRSGTNSDSKTYQVGPFFSTPLSEFTLLRAGGGIQKGTFEANSATTTAAAATTDESDLNDSYFNLALVNRLNRFTTQTLTIGHETGLADFSNFYTADFQRYLLSFNFTHTAISTSLYRESQEDSGGFTQESLERVGGGINIRHQLNRKMTLYIGYTYGESDSEVLSGAAFNAVSLRDPNDPTRLRNVPGTDITQATFSFDIAYPLTQEVDVVLGYRRLTTESSNADGNFTENRGSINFSYNF